MFHNIPSPRNHIQGIPASASSKAGLSKATQPSTSHSLSNANAGPQARGFLSSGLFSVLPLRCGTVIAAMGGDQSTQGPNAATDSGRPPRVCVLGGGFGGLYTALKLDDLLWPQGRKPEITLVDRSDRFVFKPLLYELVNGTATASEVAPTFTEVLGASSIRFVLGSVASIKAEGAEEGASSRGGGVVTLTDGTTLAYDWLVLALGSDVTAKGVPGAKENAIPFNTYEDTVRINEAIARLEATKEGPGSIRCSVVGSGYAGVELAATLAERLGSRGRVMLVGPGGILDGGPEGQRKASEAALRSLGVEFIGQARVQSVEKKTVSSEPEPVTRLHVTYADGRSEDFSSDLVLWTAGARPATEGTIRNDSAGRIALPFPTTSRGATMTDPTLRVLNHTRVFALGDVATVADGQRSDQATALPQTAQVAFQQADYVAWNVWASINHRPTLPFRYQHLGDMMSLGRTGGAVALPFELPQEVSSAVQQSPLGPLLDLAGVKMENGLTLTGPLAQGLRRAAYLYRQPTNDQRLRTAASWLELAQQQLAKSGFGPIGGMAGAAGEGTESEYRTNRSTSGTASGSTGSAGPTSSS